MGLKPTRLVKVNARKNARTAPSVGLKPTRLVKVDDLDEDRRASWAKFSIGQLGWYTFARGDTGKYPVAPRIERLDDMNSGEFVAVCMPLARALLDMHPAPGSPHPRGGTWGPGKLKQLEDWQEELSEFLEEKRGLPCQQPLWGDAGAGHEPPSWDTVARWYVINFLAQTELLPIPVYPTKHAARRAYEERIMQLQRHKREREEPSA